MRTASHSEAPALHEFGAERRVVGGNAKIRALQTPLLLNLRGAVSPEVYCFFPVKVPSPNWPSDTLPLMVFPSVLPVYFTARLPACPSTLYSMVTSSPLTVPVTCASPSWPL